jgi:protein involved in polysaccharide export with SLBB domain
MIKDSSTAFHVIVLASLFVLTLSGGPVRGQTPAAPVAEEELPSSPVARRATGPELGGPLDENQYVVGPGDVFILTIWGQSVTEVSATITPEGELVLPGVASIAVAGRTLRDVKDDVRSRLQDLYRNSEVSVTLAKLRRIRVNVLGAVSSPGAYVATAMTPASELVHMAGGLIEGASERNIAIARRGGDRERLDLTRYRNTGDLSADPPITDGDVVFVPHATALVSITGGVARPGEFELVAGETIPSLIEVAGGLARGAVADTVEVSTFTEEGTRRSILVDVGSSAGASYALKDGDQVVVRFDPNWRALTRVAVEGEVAFPGEYGITEGDDRLSDVIRRAGGLTGDASLGLARILRTSVELTDDLEYARLEQMDVGDMSDSEYAYFKSRTRQLPGTVSVDFAAALAGDASQDPLLVGGDRIEIPRRETAVEVIGQVVRPGRVTHVPGKRFGYYVRQAGGYASGAQRGGTRVINAVTGGRRRAARAGALDPGDIVWVPESDPVDWWEVVKDVAAFASTLATLYLIIDRQ